MIENLIGSILGGIAQAVPGFLAAFSGKASDDAAIAHARTVAQRFSPVLPKMRARSQAAREAAARVTVADLANARRIAGSPATGVSNTASILRLVEHAEHSMAEDESARTERAEDATAKHDLPGPR